MRRTGGADAEAGTLHAYLAEIGKIPAVSLDEERDLGRRIRLGDGAALQRLVEGNLRFVVSYAKRYRNLGVGFLDLIHEGNLGLMEAARRFDPGRNVKFISYAVWWVRQAILHALSDQGRIVSVPAKLARPAARIGFHLAALSADLGRTPTMQELADELGVSEADARALLQMHGDDVSLTGGREPGGAEARREVGDVLEQELMPRVDDALVHEAVDEQLRRAVAELRPREREVMRLRFGLGGGEALTLQQVGDRLGLSRERVRQIEARAKERLRRSARLQGLKSALN